jgi:hypothetical protein
MREFSGSCRSDALYQGTTWVGPSRPQQRSGLFRGCVRTQKKPHISPLRCAPVLTDPLVSGAVGVLPGSIDESCSTCARLRIVSGHAFAAGCAKDGLKPGFSPYPSRTAARLFLELLSTECPSVSVHQLGVDVASLWLRHGCPWSIGCGDPRSQKRDLGHPSRFSDTVRSGDRVRAEAQFPFSSLEKRAFLQPA